VGQASAYADIEPRGTKAWPKSEEKQRKALKIHKEWPLGLQVRYAQHGNFILMTFAGPAVEKPKTERPKARLMTTKRTLLWMLAKGQQSWSLLILGAGSRCGELWVSGVWARPGAVTTDRERGCTS
jgi:hypothetical protein